MTDARCLEFLSGGRVPHHQILTSKGAARRESPVREARLEGLSHGGGLLDCRVVEVLRRLPLAIIFLGLSHDLIPGRLATLIRLSSQLCGQSSIGSRRSSST